MIDLQILLISKMDALLLTKNFHPINACRRIYIKRMKNAKNKRQKDDWNTDWKALSKKGEPYIRTLFGDPRAHDVTGFGLVFAEQLIISKNWLKALLYGITNLYNRYIKCIPEPVFMTRNCSKSLNKKDPLGALSHNPPTMSQVEKTLKKIQKNKTNTSPLLPYSLKEKLTITSISNHYTSCSSLRILLPHSQQVQNILHKVTNTQPTSLPLAPLLN